MNKEYIFGILDNEGYTKASVTHPDFPKNIVIQHLDQSGKSEDFKDYYKFFIDINFK